MVLLDLMLPGMNGEELRYLFDRFYKADKTRTDIGKGTGLG